MTHWETSLPKCESCLYFVAWAGGIAYSAYKLSLTNPYFFTQVDLYDDFAPGWSWIGNRQDVSDEEWKIWIPLMIELIPWIIFHHSVSHIVKATFGSISLCCWYAFTSASFLCYYLGALGMLCILLQITLLYTLTYKCRKTIIWFVHIAFLFVIHFLKAPDGFFQVTLGFGDKEHYILTLTMCWIQLRSISYSIDSIENNSITCSYGVIHFLQSLIWKLGYCLYLPTLSLGPLILYHEFLQSIHEPSQIWSLKRLISFTLHTVRYVFWIYFATFFLHFIYLNAVQYHPEIVQILNPWALYGLGYCMGQFFLIKYVVVYGFNGNLCALDNIQAPPQPKCIARIHLYSDMWKYFDRGLYKFLIRYIYMPILEQNLSKFFGSFLCFGLIFIWHGMQISIFIWALLNFIGVTIESITRSMAKTKQYIDLQKKYLTPQIVRRLNCALASPLLTMSAISNFYFFAGKEIGDIYVKRLMNDSWNTLFLLHFFLYCCCQVSLDIRNWEQQKFPKLMRKSQM